MSNCCTVPEPEEQAPENAVDACCGPEAELETGFTFVSPARETCPRCGEKGKKVDTMTVKAMLAISLEAIRPVSYRFCRTETCPVAYFSADGQVFYEDDLRERVHQKHPDADDVFVCYCFRHTPGSIRAELLEAGRSTVIERVSAGVKAGQCACEIRNPQGSCCLGNVTQVVKWAQTELITPVPPTTSAFVQASKE